MILIEKTGTYASDVLEAMEEYANQFKQPSLKEKEIQLFFSKNFGKFETGFRRMIERSAEKEECDFVYKFIELWKETQSTQDPLLIDFDLKTALAHPERVRTRDGDLVSQIYYFSEALNYVQKLYCIINGDMHTFSDDGRYSSKIENAEYDLFLIAETKTANFHNNAAHRAASYLIGKFQLLKDKDGNYLSLQNEVIKNIVLFFVHEAEGIKNSHYINEAFFKDMRDYINKVS